MMRTGKRCSWKATDGDFVGAGPPGDRDAAADASGSSQQPKARLRWTPQLHARFLAACNSLGGPDKVREALALCKAVMGLVGGDLCV